jgi:hypothetical protein
MEVVNIVPENIFKETIVLNEETNNSLQIHAGKFHCMAFNIHIFQLLFPRV